MGGMTLPGGLASLLNDLGYTWPNVDETGLLGMGGSWMKYGGEAQQAPQDAHGHAMGVWSGNSGQAIDAFEKAWNHPQAPHANLMDASTGSMGIGTGLMVCAGIVIALKINVIVQLVSLAIEIVSAIAESAITFGASLLEIPVFKEITGMLINLVINLSLNAIMGG
jgi:hypothetical protein